MFFNCHNFINTLTLWAILLPRLALNRKVTIMFKFLRLLVSSIGFLQIVLGPTIAGGLIGFFIYYAKADATGLTIGIIVAALGLIGGIVWGISVSKRQDPADYVSQIRASPDLNGDNPDF